ncbi:hypothetical protein PC113_g21871 [Phytophthora cactorum]|uniref:Uncharacterized protein n=1 Tax=Phytophthora cactorum TaxID=29920 RepID=A0A8T0YHU2_9STRA|nr:hypothetical protein PC113_g21871 [Phytophthora cactorum]
MVESRKEAKQLVQWTLLPVTTLRSVARVLKATYSYESAYEFLSKFAVKTLGPRKQAIPKCRNLLEENKQSLLDPELHVGVRISKAGVLNENQLQVLADCHDTMSSLTAVSDAVEWMAATALNRLDIPNGLDEYAELDKGRALAQR